MSKKKKKQDKLPDGLVAIKPFKLPRFVVVERQFLTPKAPPHDSSVQAMFNFLLPIARESIKLAEARPDYYLTPGEIDPSGHVTTDGFVVHSGSRFFGDDATSPARVQEIRTALKRCGALTVCEEGFKLETDLTFDSPATAASVLLGREVNVSVWKDHKGRTIEENQAAAASPLPPEAT